jgi:mono/diheme cytochrome c family protein
MRRPFLVAFACTLAMRGEYVKAQTNGLTPEERKTWYHLSQGTEFLPYDFFKALKDFQTGGMLFDSFKDFGFLEDVGQHNPEKLPVGISLDETRDLRFAGVQMIGLNCAACHTAELKHQGKVLRIDGATAMVNVNGFSTRVGQSIQKTLTDPREFLQFVHRVVQQKSRPLAFPLAGSLHEKLIAHFEELITDDERILKRVQAMLDERFQEKPVIDVEKVIAPKTALDSLPARLKKMDEAEERLKAPATQLLKEVFELDPRPAALRLFGLGHNAILRSTIGEIVIIHRLLRARFESFKEQMNRVKTTPGFGRVDAFGTARNKLFPEHAQDLDAPVRFPFIWEIGILEWFHWDGNTTSATERNVGEALGVGVIVDPATGESTIRLDNLLRLEAFAAKLQPPQWPADVLGPIDEAKRAAGAKLFKKHCAKCHDILGSTGKIKDMIVGIDKLKTDGLRVKNIRRPVGGDGFFDAISPILKKVIDAAEVDAGNPKLNHWRPSKQSGPVVVGYPNRQLRAVWASPPYLHNGSVPNIYELLLPPDQRSKRFKLGAREYDREKLGYLEDGSAKFEFDTTVEGNFNTGHDYNNAQFTDSQRFDLIEYLKSR